MTEVLTTEWRHRKPPAKIQAEIMSRQNGCCFYCELKFGDLFEFGCKLLSVDLSFDHVLPYSYAGSNSDHNFVAACLLCNSIKSSLVFDSLNEAKTYVRNQRSKRNLPVSTMQKDCEKEEALAEVLFEQMPNGQLLGKSQSCENQPERILRRMRKKSKRNDELREVCATMPPLSHWPDRQKPFAYENSEVVHWLLKQPVAMQRIFDIAKEIGAIQFDEKSGLWSGQTN